MSFFLKLWRLYSIGTTNNLQERGKQLTHILSLNTLCYYNHGLVKYWQFNNFFNSFLRLFLNQFLRLPHLHYTRVQEL